MNNRKKLHDYSHTLKHVATISIITIILCAGCCIAQEMKPGMYHLETRTLLPHLEEMRRTVTTENICLEENKIERLFPILKQPGMVDCRFLPTSKPQKPPRYSLSCPGANGAKGLAVVVVLGDVIDAELNAKLGGKNMTFSQFADATLLGPCEDQDPSIFRAN